jgi:hypothetical protein
MTTQQAYRSLLRYECEHRKPTAAELAGMRAEIERLRLLIQRYEASANQKGKLNGKVQLLRQGI